MSERVAYDVDRALQDSLIAASACLDLDKAATVISDCLDAVAAQARALKEMKYGKRKLQLRCPGCGARHEYKVPAKPEDIARAMAHTGKVMDETTRLAAFAKGQPDSRPDLGGGNRDLLAMLTPEQFATVEAWVLAAQARLA